MGNKQKNYNRISEPLRVLLNSRSEEALKTLDNGPVLKHTYRDFVILKDLIYGEDIIKKSKDALEQHIYLYLISALSDPRVKEVYSALYKNLYTKGGVLREVFDLIFSRDISEVPLQINKPYMEIISKWRLLINK